MNKLTTADFDVASATEVVPTKTRSERLQDWRKKNEAAYKQACDDHCTCTPTRAQMLLIEQYQGNGPVDL